MKISYENFALNFLDDRKNISFGIPTNDQGMTPIQEKMFGHQIRNILGDAIPYMKESVRLISAPFHQAYFNNRHKLASVIDKIDQSPSGTLLYKSQDQYTTIFYIISTNGKTGHDWSYNLMLFVFTKKKGSEFQHLDAYVSKSGDDWRNCVYKEWVDQGRDASWWATYILSFVCFLKFCEIETKVVEPKRKASHAGEKYINETSQRIEILNSSWFTSLVVSGAFKVSGHFRLQPFKENGSWTKKLIWISDYEKDGYTRKAKALNQ